LALRRVVEGNSKTKINPLGFDVSRIQKLKGEGVQKFEVRMGEKRNLMSQTARPLMK
jgi:hypothetical protein